MPITTETITRREVLAGLGAGAAALALPGCAATAQRVRATGEPAALLDDIAYNLLAREPDRATTLGVDVGPYSMLRGKLEDVSPAGQQAYAETLRADLARVRAVDSAALDPATRTSFEVVESAYATALDGLALPYGDVAVGSWRNTPYVVIQNVGGYLDYPRFLDSDHPVNSAADAEAYLARLEAIPAALDGELERVRSAAALGLIPPAFLLAKTIPQMEASLADARAGGTLVESLTRRTTEANIAGDWASRARRIVTGPIAAALERQLTELRRQQTLATDEAGMWARPRGDEWYAWGLRASTTTRMTAGEIHQMGLDQLAEIHGRMDPILRSLGYTSGSVGERMQQLGDDPRFKFPEGDPGRAEIMDFIQQRLAWIRAQMPRAFTTLVPARL